MSRETQERIQELRAALAALERQRHVLGETATEAALAGLRDQLRVLETEPSEREERRQVTVLFADLADYTRISEQLDPEDVQDIMEAYFQRWKRVLAAHGGTVEKFIGDAVMAVFGIPASHEDDPVRAVRAALKMQQSLVELNKEREEKQLYTPLQMRVGIDTGPVVVRIDKLQQRKDLGVIGDTVNTASRMEAVAPLGEILISYETFRHLGGAFEVQPLEPVVLKGKKRPVRIYKVTGWAKPSGAAGKPAVEGVLTRMIGREEELLRLQTAFRLVEEKRECRLVTIVGEAGVGKSRLAYEFHSWLKSRPRTTRFLRAHSSREKQFVPFALLHDLFVDRCGIRGSDSSEEAVRKLMNVVSTVLSDERSYSGDNNARSTLQGEASSQPRPTSEVCAHFIGELIGLDIVESPHLLSVRKDPQQVRDRGLAYISDFLKAEASNVPVVLLLEDIHWADESSLEALVALRRRLARERILLLALARPMLFQRSPQWESVPLAAGSNVEMNRERIDLSVLSRKASARLVEEILQRVSELPSNLRNLIVDNAEGNPLFIEELIKKLIEDGVLVKSTDGWFVQKQLLPELAVPPTLTRILQARLDMLYQDEEAVLKRASVMGRIFWDKAISCIGEPGTKPLSNDKIVSALASLQNKEMIFHRSTSAFEGTREFIFKHAMLREVAYERILKRHRSSYHAQAAAWLTDQSAERSGEFAGLIAEHYERAGQPEKALRYLCQAGHRAAANFGNAEAASYFTRALERVPEDDISTRFELIAARESVFDLEGSRERQAHDIEAMEQLAETTSDEFLLSQSALRRANFARRIGDYACASEAARTALAHAELVLDTRRQAESRLQLGAVLMTTGDQSAADQEFRQALELARNAKEQSCSDTEIENDTTATLSRIEASALRGLGLVAYRREEYEAARSYQLQSLELCRRIGDRRGEGLTLTNLGNAHAAVSDFDAARNCHEEALRVTHEIGDRQGESKVLNNVGSVCIAQGDYPSARSYLEESLRIKQEIGDRPGESTTLANLGAVARDQGDFDEAESCFRQAVDIRRAFHDRGGETMAMAGLASVLQAVGDYERAKRHGDEAVRIALEIHDKEDECYTKGQLGLLYHEMGDNESALTLTNESLTAARALGTREGEAAGLMCLGHAFVELRRCDEAKAAYEKALAIRHALGQRYLAMDALAGLARLALQRGSPEEALVHVEHILDFLETGTLIGLSQSFRVRLTCYQVLSANNDPRASQVLHNAYNLLLDRAEKIGNPERRRFFLENVPYNREIVETYREIASKEPAE